MNTTLETVASADGTLIAFERAGTGSPVILIGGAFKRPVHRCRTGRHAGASHHRGGL